MMMMLINETSVYDSKPQQLSEEKRRKEGESMTLKIEVFR